jgi:hypothetical protein
MADKINIIVERDGEFHKFKFNEKGNCNNCSLFSGEYDGIDYDACDICIALGDGLFEKVITKGAK